ncbi:hypothetical protein THTE_4495 [Thermogutta terrifontis]|uniref:Uncharacterized protein n=1 Tax=Thermogutta terrifontis TaxID=1331910 RepID=A0A286RMB6_9BACT|nr:hypothetical protein THTE_4495 [Thermogutta terrifontis]
MKTFRHGLPDWQFGLFVAALFARLSFRKPHGKPDRSASYYLKKTCESIFLAT